jgi:hypothetical protein
VHGIPEAVRRPETRGGRPPGATGHREILTLLLCGAMPLAALAE